MGLGKASEEKIPDKKQQWVTVAQAEKILNRSANTLYVQAFNDKKRGCITRYKKIKDVLYVNISVFTESVTVLPDAVTQKTQAEFEKLYFFLIERQTKKSLYEFIGSKLGKKPHAVQGYLWEVFHTGTETTKMGYVKAMKELAVTYYPNLDDLDKFLYEEMAS